MRATTSPLACPLLAPGYWRGLCTTHGCASACVAVSRCAGSTTSRRRMRSLALQQYEGGEGSAHTSVCVQRGGGARSRPVASMCFHGAILWVTKQAQPPPRPTQRRGRAVQYPCAPFAPFVPEWGIKLPRHPPPLRPLLHPTYSNCLPALSHSPFADAVPQRVIKLPGPLADLVEELCIIVCLAVEGRIAAQQDEEHHTRAPQISL